MSDKLKFVAPVFGGSDELECGAALVDKLKFVGLWFAGSGELECGAALVDKLKFVGLLKSSPIGWMASSDSQRA